ncbi:MAG: tetratricopeptide repeat protein [Actinobacteria bacterium]|nr:tetratricopeptide repeat protein [Actinomycetota bacterium]
MTLNMTAITQRHAYQAADYRLTDAQTGEVRDFETQKCVIVTTFSWTALVCFTGIGRTSSLDISEWLAEQVKSVGPDEPFDTLTDALISADSWLKAVPEKHRRHSFSIAAFIRSQPVFQLISNFETPTGLMRAPQSHFSLYTVRVARPTVFLAGQRSAITRAERRRLAAFVSRDPAPGSVHSLLVELNEAAATRSEFVSAACFTGHATHTGEWDGRPHGVEGRPFFPSFVVPKGMEEAIKRLLDDQFGPGRAQLVGLTGARAEASNDYHRLQVREKQSDPSVHSNYGAFLADQRRDLEGAEKQYRRALELDPSHVNALGNLANLLWSRGETEEALELYTRALEIDPGNENVTWNFARVLASTGRLGDATGILDSGIGRHPESGRLRLLRAESLLMAGDPKGALESARHARERGADQAKVEAAFAVALQMGGASVGECIAAYRVALSIDSANAALRLNLAQLLFLRGDDAEARWELREAQRLGLDSPSQLEALFYELAHVSTDISRTIQRINDILSAGVHLNWNVQANVDKVAETRPRTGPLLSMLYRIMAGHESQSALEGLTSELEHELADG